jgi:hypothetical protein
MIKNIGRARGISPPEEVGYLISYRNNAAFISVENGGFGGRGFTE